jgi:hypothetical protein
MKGREEEEEGVFKAKAMNEVDAGHARATPASVRHRGYPRSEAG